MTKDIINKLRAELDRGICSEVQVVYLLVGIRKLIERDELNEAYPALGFHCDWALHSKLDRAGAKAILQLFDSAHPSLKENHELPAPLRNKIDQISKMHSFREELSRFLNANQLPQVTLHRSDGWEYFLSLYTRIVEDIPLELKSAGSSTVTKVTVHCEAGKEAVPSGDRKEIVYKVTWRIFDKNGELGGLSVINSYSELTDEVVGRDS